MMKRLHFVCDEELDKKFPAQRICRAVIRTKDGRELRSAEYEPRGEAKEHIQWPWLEEKFRRVTGPVLTKEGQDKAAAMILGPEDLRMTDYVKEINRKEFWKEL
jgi:2-methylcitrate dehydratase PrpD